LIKDLLEKEQERGEEGGGRRRTGPRSLIEPDTTWQGVT
jgi:hypothetical protein